MDCPLCKNNVKDEFVSANGRTYYQCENCGLVFTAREFYLSDEEEKGRYCFHQNNINDEGYVNFLSQLAEPLSQFLKDGESGLDYGCGPGPVLAELLNRKGFSCDIYDPYFFPELDNTKQYDFITATECFEHFHNPADELNKIAKILKPGGFLAVMTEFYTSDKVFADWYYIKDPTHVCFYSIKSFDFICRIYGLSIVYCDEKRVVIIRKK
jgi:SAM-dependent methyltransferase